MTGESFNHYPEAFSALELANKADLRGVAIQAKALLESVTNSPRNYQNKPISSMGKNGDSVVFGSGSRIGEHSLFSITKVHGTQNIVIHRSVSLEGTRKEYRIAVNDDGLGMYQELGRPLEQGEQYLNDTVFGYLLTGNNQRTELAPDMLSFVPLEEVQDIFKTIKTLRA